jgi:urea transport system ATP-binding protein
MTTMDNVTPQTAPVNNPSGAHTASQIPLVRHHVFDFLKPPLNERIAIGNGPILYMEGVSVSFDGFKAINDLDFSVDRKELRCVIGPNGAGKSTMMDIITGKTRPDTGRVYFGESLNLLQCTEAEIANAGVGRKFQKPTVFEALTCGQNLELAMSGEKGFWRNVFHRLSSEQSDRIESVADTIGLKEQLFDVAGKLSHGQKQWLEIGMLLMQQPHVLLVDEPVAGMTHQEMEKTGELLELLCQDHTVVVVEHDMEFIRSIARRVTVLHQGSVLAEGSMHDVQENADVRRVYLGE